MSCTNYCGIAWPSIPKRNLGEQTYEATTMARFYLGIELSDYYDEMIAAESYGKLIFTYLGPNTIQYNRMKPYNCYLELLSGTVYFLSNLKPDFSNL